MLDQAVDQALEALNTYDWGTDVAVVRPIEEAVVVTHGDLAARQELEKRLAEKLSEDLSRDAKDYVCRKLTMIGTAASVSALATLLTDAELSHMARYALERIPAPEAGQALRDALPKVDGELKIGVIGSLAKRPQESDSVVAIAPLVNDSNPAVAKAAILALGRIRTAEAARALDQAKPSGEQEQLALIDARLACAEAMLASGDRVKAMAVYKPLTGGDQPKHVRLAATRGLLACAGKKPD